MNHVIITMMNYRRDNEKEFEQFKKRFEIYKNFTLPSIKRQKKKGFDIAVLCDKKNDDLFKKLGVIPFHTKNGYAGHYDNTWHFWTPWSNIEGLGKYDIQTCVQSDDKVSEDYTRKIEEVIEQNKEGKKSIHVGFQPRLYNLETGEDKKMKARYTHGSPFFAIYQPNKEKYYFLHHDSHIRISKYFDKKISVGEGYCWLSVHDDSLSLKSMNI